MAIRTAVVTDIPTPYRDPLWARYSRRPEVDLTVFYMAPGEKDLDWEPSWEMPPRHEILPGRTWITRPDNPLTFKWNPTLWDVLDRERPQMILLGSWGQPTSWVTMAWARANAVPYAMQCESHLLDPRPIWKRALKHVVVRAAVSGQVAGLPTGSLARTCMIHYGADPDDLFLFPNTPDAERLAGEAKKLRQERAALRRRWGIEGRQVVLFVGRLVAVKGVDVLLEAFSLLRERHPRALPWIVGDGSQRSSLEALARRKVGEGNALFTGFVEPDRLPECYVAADVFCLPSRSEPWGVVVNEAMACGLPVVLSDRVGAARDLVDHDCGRLVPPDDPRALASALEIYLGAGEEERQRAGLAGRARALEWAYPRCLESLEKVRVRAEIWRHSRGIKD